MVPCNIWLLETPEMVIDYSLRGGRVIFITEDIDARLDAIPNKISAKILLPPFEATELELDGRIDESSAIYFRYLSSMEPAEYISVIIAGVVQGLNIGLYFGEQLRDMKFPLIFLNFLRDYKGLVVGTANNQPGYIREFLPIVLSDLYTKGLVSADRFLAAMPIGDALPMHTIPKLIFDLKIPDGIVKNEDYVSYFKEMISAMNKHGKFPILPIVTKEERYTW